MKFMISILTIATAMSTVAMAEDATSNATSASTSAASAGVTTGSLAEAKKAAEGSKFTFGFTNWDLSAQQVAPGDSRTVDSVNFFELGYKVGEKSKVYVRENFTLMFGSKYDADVKKRNPDDWQTLGFNTVAPGIAGSGDLAVVVRYDLPTSEAHREAKWRDVKTQVCLGAAGENPTAADLARCRVEGESDIVVSNGRLYSVVDVPWTINKDWNVTYEAVPWFYFYKQNTPTMLRLNQQVSLGYNVTDTLSITTIGGFESRWYEVGAGEKKSDFTEFETGVTWNPIKELSIYASVSNEVNIMAGARTWALYRAEENTYNLITSLTF
jgi:hypothetical protein